jgi:hypothetical protein
VHIVIGILAVAAAVCFWIVRARNAAGMAGDALEMGRDVIGAARQWNFKRRTNVHPVDGIDTPDLAAGALAFALTELGGLSTRERRAALSDGLARAFALPSKDVEEMLVLADWLVTSCNGPALAAPRLARRLRKLNGEDRFDKTVEAFRTAAAVDGDLNDAQREALADAARTLGRR